MAQVCNQFTPFLFRVEELDIEELDINSTQSLREQWLDLLRAFGGARDISVADELATVILCALCHSEDPSVLPSLRRLRVQKPMVMRGPSWDAVQSFIKLRSISGRPVQVDAPSYQCHICDFSSEEQQALKRHLRDNHKYQILCPYCSDFEPKYTLGSNYLVFQEHLENKHPDIARMDTQYALISSSSQGLFITRFHRNSLLDRHSFLSTPDIDTPSTTGTPPSPIARDSNISLADKLLRLRKNRKRRSTVRSLVPSLSSSSESEDISSYMIGK